MQRDKKSKVHRDNLAIYDKEVSLARRIEGLPLHERLVLEHTIRGKDDFSHFCESLLGMRVHPGQADVVSLMYGKDFGVLAAANGWGKTILYALIMLWATYNRSWAINRNRYLAVVLGPEMKQALLTHEHIEAIRNDRHEGQVWDAKQHYFLLKDRLIPFKTQDGHYAYRWRHNGAVLRFESAEGKASSIEGWAPNLVIYDEARLELHLRYIVEEVIMARGVRTENMKVLLGSTPLMDSYDLLDYYKRGELGDRDWWSRSGHISDNVYLSAKQIEKIRRNLDPRVRDQVLAGKFVEPPDAYFIAERVQEVFDSGREPGDITEYYGKADPSHTYVAGADAAVSEGGDESAVTVWDVTTTPHKVVIEKVLPKGTPLEKLVAYCDVLIQEFSCQVGFDAQGPLGVQLEHMVSMDPGWWVPVKFGGKSVKGGTTSQKTDALANFRHFINEKLWWCPNIPGLKAQILSYSIKKDKDLKKDRLMAQVYAAWVAKDYLTPDQYGFKLNELENVYSGQGYDFGPHVDKTKSPSMQKWLSLVHTHNQQQREVSDL